MNVTSKRLRDPSFRLLCSYLFDWIFCIVLLLLFFLLDNTEPFHRQFSVQNTAIMFPYAEKETIPTWALALIAVVFPVAVIAVVGLGVRRSPYDFHNGILGLLVSVLLTTIFTQVIKVTVGKHRPDFLSRCQPMLNGAPLTHDEPLHLWTIDVCTQTDHAILKDGFRSFPSGHASTSFAGLFYISLWLGGKMHPFDRRGYSLKAVILVVPVVVFAYHQYYPAITAARSHVPHPPRDFSYLTKDSEGNTQEAGNFEHITGIQRNDSLVDEARNSPEEMTTAEERQNSHIKPQDATHLV
ncbi:hypothetical protein BGX26_004290 [Mortierella sp. AD094]|nr:hypothetical protein BGX26_004290 [Mortierella sp. AD094]